MNIAVTGSSGFVGTALTQRLTAAGHQVRPVSVRSALPAGTLQDIDAVVHLAGEPVAQRWTEAARQRIRQSRIQGTRYLVDAMREHPPQVLISASAIGYYGDRGDDVLTEEEPAAANFLGRVASEWEREAMAAESLGVRVCRIRFGVVLGPDGGALDKMLLPFKLGVGGRIGSGKQWMSWIHLQDLISLIEFLIPESTVRGVFNGTSPHPVTNAEFTQVLGKVLHRPTVLPVPGFALRLALGQMAEVVLGSQRVLPEAATRAGFTFQYPDIHGALTEILG